MLHIVFIISLIATTASFLWFYFSGGFEPIIVALFGIAGLVKSVYDLALKENLFDYNAMANLAWVEHKDNNSEIAKKLIEKVCKAKPNKERFKDLRYRIENGISTLK